MARTQAQIHVRTPADARATNLENACKKVLFIVNSLSANGSAAETL